MCISLRNRTIFQRPVAKKKRRRCLGALDALAAGEVHQTQAAQMMGTCGTVDVASQAGWWLRFLPL